MLSIGIDLGGTNIAAGVVNENFEIVAKDSIRCDRSAGRESLITSMRELAERVVAQAGVSMNEIAAVGMGVPGTTIPETKALCHASNLDILDGMKMSEVFPYMDNNKLFIENDANAAAFGEALAGAGKGKKNMVMLTLGTGVGCGIVIDGKIYGGFNGAAGEAGHTVIMYNGRQCNCGRKGCFETYASATGLIKSTKEAMEQDKNSVMWQICGGDINKVDGKTVFMGKEQGDNAAKRVIDEYANILACGIINIILLIQPELIVIGGGVAGQKQALLQPIMEVYERERYKTSGKYTGIEISQCDNAGLIGAAMLYRQ